MALLAIELTTTTHSLYSIIIYEVYRCLLCAVYAGDCVRIDRLYVDSRTLGPIPVQNRDRLLLVFRLQYVRLTNLVLLLLYGRKGLVKERLLQVVSAGAIHRSPFRGGYRDLDSSVGVGRN